MRRLRTWILAVAAAACCGTTFGQTGAPVTTDLTQVVAKPLEKTVQIPGELAPYQTVDIHAKVSGFVNSVEVDRGSRVKEGRLLATMTAPELDAQRAEAEARIAAIEAQRAEAAAKLAAAQSTLERLQEAARTPGVVAGNDLVLADKAAEAERSKVVSLEKSVAAAEAAVRSIEEIEKYLRITAPFSGVITERYMHPGSLAGPAGNARTPLFRLEQVSRLRLVVPVPEAYVESVRQGTRVGFTVPAYPGRKFFGTVARPAHSVDPETRTMPVELDVDNSSGRLAPGMYAETSWPVRRSGESLFVPPSAVKSTTERTFVVRVKEGVADWVDVRRGMMSGDLLEVFGDLQPGDTVVARATDEIRPGTIVRSSAKGQT